MKLHSQSRVRVGMFVTVNNPNKLVKSNTHLLIDIFHSREISVLSLSPDEQNISFKNLLKPFCFSFFNVTGSW